MNAARRDGVKVNIQWGHRDECFCGRLLVPSHHVSVKTAGWCAATIQRPNSRLSSEEPEKVRSKPWGCCLFSSTFKWLCTSKLCLRVRLLMQSFTGTSGGIWRKTFGGLWHDGAIWALHQRLFVVFLIHQHDHHSPPILLASFTSPQLLLLLDTAEECGTCRCVSD